MQYKLIPYILDYAQDFYNEYTDEIAQYMYLECFKSLDEVISYFNQSCHFDKIGETLHYLILDKKEFLGAIEVYNLNDEYPEIGVWIKKSKQSSGIASIVLSQLLILLNNQYKKEYYMYCFDINNQPSRSLLNKFNYSYGYHTQLITETFKVLEVDVYLFNIKNN